MKMNRRNMLKTIGVGGAVGLPLAQICTAQSNKTDAKAGSADSIPVRPLKLDAEPLVVSRHPVHDRFRSGLEEHLKEQAVVITARDLKPLDWDVQPECDCLLLRLPEMCYIGHKRHDYQTGMKWRKQGANWSYTDCPLRNLTGCWKTMDGKTQLAAENVPTIGRINTDIVSDSLGIRYTLTVTNTSSETWTDVYFWICLNYYHMRILGYRPYLRVGDSWVQAQDMPSARSHRYYPAPGMLDEYKRSMADRDEFQGACTELSFPGVVCWNHTADGDLLLCHYSDDALDVGSNQLWPCTDLHLWFGNLAPGEQKSKTGRVLAARCDLKTFAKYIDSTLVNLKS